MGRHTIRRPGFANNSGASSTPGIHQIHCTALLTQFCGSCTSLQSYTTVQSNLACCGGPLSRSCVEFLTGTHLPLGSVWLLAFVGL